MASLCHPWFTTTNLSYRFPIFETSATALCGTTGRQINKYIHIHVYHMPWDPFKVFICLVYMFVICFALFHCLPICTHVCEFTLVCVWAFESLRSEMLALCNEYARRNFNSWRAKSIQNTYAPATQANSCFSPRWSLASYHQTDGTKFHLTWIVVHGRSTARDSRSCCEFFFFSFTIANQPRSQISITSCTDTKE